MIRMSAVILVAAIPVALLGWVLVRDFMAGLDDERVWSDEYSDGSDLAT